MHRFSAGSLTINIDLRKLTALLFHLISPYPPLKNGGHFLFLILLFFLFGILC